MRRADLEDILAQQGIEDRRLAPADHAERGDLDRGLVELLAQVAELRELVGQGGLFLGGELQALPRCPPGSRVPLDRDVGFAGFFSSWSSSSLEFVVGHERSLSLTRRCGWLLRTSGRRRRWSLAIVTADELDCDRQAVGRETDRERDRRQAGVAPGRVERRVPSGRRIGGGADRRRRDQGVAASQINLATRSLRFMRFRHPYTQRSGTDLAERDQSILELRLPVRVVGPRGSGHGCAEGNRPDLGQPIGVHCGGLRGHDRAVIVEDLVEVDGIVQLDDLRPAATESTQASSSIAAGPVGPAVEEAAQPAKSGRRSSTGSGRRLAWPTGLPKLQVRLHRIEEKSQVVDGSCNRTDVVEAGGERLDTDSS